MLGSSYHDDNVIIIRIIPDFFLIFLRLSAIFMGTYGTWRRSCIWLVIQVLVLRGTHIHLLAGWNLDPATLSGLVTEPERMAMVVNQAGLAEPATAVDHKRIVKIHEGLSENRLNP